jgi:uncharacterized protein (DUF4415 family)
VPGQFYPSPISPRASSIHNRGPKAEKRLQHVTIRLGPEVVAKSKAIGKGWQTRINEVLKAAKIGAAGGA